MKYGRAVGAAWFVHRQAIDQTEAVRALSRHRHRADRAALARRIAAARLRVLRWMGRDRTHRDVAAWLGVDYEGRFKPAIGALMNPEEPPHDSWLLKEIEAKP